MARILVVEDDVHIRDLIVLHLGLEGLDTEAVADGRDALVRGQTGSFDLIILDLMLPGVDGIAVARAIRREGPNQDVPILMLTARGDESDKVLGLESGADDYLVKPFGIRELVARVRALLRRTRQTVAPVGERLESAGLLLDAGRHRVTLEGREIALKPKEFDLLAFFMGHPGQVFGREQLLASVWGYDFAGDSRTVDTHVKTLREKLGDDAEHPRWIDTVRGVGYRFREPSPV